MEADRSQHVRATTLADARHSRRRWEGSSKAHLRRRKTSCSATITVHRRRLIGRNIDLAVHLERGGTRRSLHAAHHSYRRGGIVALSGQVFVAFIYCVDEEEGPLLESGTETTAASFCRNGEMPREREVRRRRPLLLPLGRTEENGGGDPTAKVLRPKTVTEREEPPRHPSEEAASHRRCCCCVERERKLALLSPPRSYVAAKSSVARHRRFHGRDNRRAATTRQRGESCCLVSLTAAERKRGDAGGRKLLVGAHPPVAGALLALLSSEFIEWERETMQHSGNEMGFVQKLLT
nr:hypothetical protein Iba_chr10aCG12280 [Ipomoea batatas]